MTLFIFFRKTHHKGKEKILSSIHEIIINIFCHPRTTRIALGKHKTLCKRHKLSVFLFVVYFIIYDKLRVLWKKIKLYSYERFFFCICLFTQSRRDKLYDAIDEGKFDFDIEIRLTFTAIILNVP